MPAFTVIDHTEIGSGGAASWTKSSIPSTYDHLLLKASIRTEDLNSAAEVLYIKLNNDSGTNYSNTDLYVGGAGSPSSFRNTSQTSANRTFAVRDGMTANTYGSLSIWIPHYANTSNYKQMLSDGTSEANTTGSGPHWEMVASLWQSTAAINRIDITPSTSDLKQYSSITLYGITNNA